MKAKVIDPQLILILIFCEAADFCKGKSLGDTKRRPKRGRKQVVTGPELLTLALFQALLGIESEHSFLRFMSRFFTGWLPLLSQPQYNRRLRKSAKLLEEFRRYLLGRLRIQTDLFLIDSLPVPLINPVRVSRSGGFPEMGFGHCAALKQDFYGARLHLVVTATGIPVLFELTPATGDERVVMEELLEGCGFLTVIGDKGYLDQLRQARLLSAQHITTIVPHRKNQKAQLSEPEKRLYHKTRKRIESVINQLAFHFDIKGMLARELDGLAARVIQKITAFTMGILLNKCFGRKWLAIRSILA